MSTTLYIVASPIGNLEDFTFRAVRVLKEVDRIFAEDTRKTGILLKKYEISKPLKSYRVHQIEPDTRHAIECLEKGENIALVTDAGTPGVSDPGSYLIRAVRERLPQTKIIPLPGASALTAALSVCGFQVNPCIFGGFPSTRPGRRRRFLEQNKEFDGVIVLFESVYRVSALLQEIRTILPDREIFVAREMTKVYEEYVRIPVGVQPRVLEKGEFTIVIGPKEGGKIREESDPSSLPDGHE